MHTSHDTQVMLEACIHGLSRATGAEAPFMTNVDEIVRQRLFPEVPGGAWRLEVRLTPVVSHQR